MAKDFICIATGNGVANLPVLLDLAKPEDKIHWLASPQATEQEWIKHPHQILWDRGFRNQDVLRGMAHAHDIHRGLSKHIDHFSDEVILVSNGGTKPMQIAAWEA
ncbi:hypothetical protein, partial [Natronospira sp.]|uniref:hypothetical protein n=1 Tax=Natronospira sp. TaxID=2024970 RepID=UPI003873BF18